MYFLHCSELLFGQKIVIVIIIIIIIIILVIKFMQGIYNYLDETKHVSRFVLVVLQLFSFYNLCYMYCDFAREICFVLLC